MHKLAVRHPSIEDFKEYIKEQFKQREEIFVDRNHLSNNDPNEAAILFLLIKPKNEFMKILGNSFNIFDYIFLLLEKRSVKVKQNPGDMAFPGGRADGKDNNLIETAYREAAEEVGIETENLDFIACMDEYVSSSQIIVRNVISWLEVDLPLENIRDNIEKRYAPKTDETESTVVIPLSDCLDPKNYDSTEFVFNSDRYGYIRYINIDKFLKETHIWGLTASMIRRFLDFVFPDNLLPEEQIFSTF